MGILQMEIFCRLCMSESTENFNVFKANEEGNLVQKILSCLSIAITEDDPLPKNICSSCYVQIQTYHLFRERALEINALFNISLVCNQLYSQEKTSLNQLSVFTKSKDLPTIADRMEGVIQHTENRYRSALNSNNTSVSVENAPYVRRGRGRPRKGSSCDAKIVQEADVIQLSDDDDDDDGDDARISGNSEENRGEQTVAQRNLPSEVTSKKPVDVFTPGYHDTDHIKSQRFSSESKQESTPTIHVAKNIMKDTAWITQNAGAMESSRTDRSVIRNVDYSYSDLVFSAIEHSARKKVTIDEIYKYLVYRYPHIRSPAFNSSVVAKSLTSDSRFKEIFEATETGWMSYWAICTQPENEKDTSVNEVISVHQSPSLPSAHQSPLVPSVHQSPLVPSAHQSPLLPSVCQSPLVPSVHQSPLVPSAHQSPLLPSVHQSPLVPSVRQSPLLSSVHQSSFLLSPLSSDIPEHASPSSIASSRENSNIFVEKEQKASFSIIDAVSSAIENNPDRKASVEEICSYMRQQLGVETSEDKVTEALKGAGRFQTVSELRGEGWLTFWTLGRGKKKVGDGILSQSVILEPIPRHQEQYIQLWDPDKKVVSSLRPEQPELNERFSESGPPVLLPPVQPELKERFSESGPPVLSPPVHRSAILGPHVSSSMRAVHEETYPSAQQKSTLPSSETIYIKQEAEEKSTNHGLSDNLMCGICKRLFPNHLILNMHKKVHLSIKNEKDSYNANDSGSNDNLHLNINNEHTDLHGRREDMKVRGISSPHPPHERRSSFTQEMESNSSRSAAAPDSRTSRSSVTNKSLSEVSRSLRSSPSLRETPRSSPRLRDTSASPSVPTGSQRNTRRETGATKANKEKPATMSRELKLLLNEESRTEKKSTQRESAAGRSQRKRSISYVTETATEHSADSDSKKAKTKTETEKSEQERNKDLLTQSMAYGNFCNLWKDKLQKSCPHLSPQELLGRLFDMWNMLPENAKTTYYV